MSTIDVIDGTVRFYLVLAISVAAWRVGYLTVIVARDLRSYLRRMRK